MQETQESVRGGILQAGEGLGAARSCRVGDVAEGQDAAGTAVAGTLGIQSCRSKGPARGRMQTGTDARLQQKFFLQPKMGCVRNKGVVLGSKELLYDPNARLIN